MMLLILITYDGNLAAAKFEIIDLEWTASIQRLLLVVGLSLLWALRGRNVAAIVLVAAAAAAAAVVVEVGWAQSLKIPLVGRFHSRRHQLLGFDPCGDRGGCRTGTVDFDCAVYSSDRATELWCAQWAVLVLEEEDEEEQQ